MFECGAFKNIFDKLVEDMVGLFFFFCKEGKDHDKIRCDPRFNIVI